MDTLRALRVLGLPPGAGAEEIKTAWRDLARVWHPDRFAHDARLQKKASDNLQRINQAYEALRDYDPAVKPRVAARMRESVAIILGIGELGEPPPVPASSPPPILEPSFTPDGPVGARGSVRVLGLGTRHRHSGGTRRRRRRNWLIGAGAATVVAAAALYYFFVATR